MQWFGACLGLVAMLVALTTAPLYHSHDRDDHGDPASLVHAHLFDAPEAEHQDDEIEARHSHDRSRWIDFFTSSAAAPLFELAFELSEELAIPSLEKFETITIPAVPCAHGPPPAGPSVARSPPSIQHA